MKKSAFFILFLFLPISLFCQNDYIIKDGKKISGVKLIVATDKIACEKCIVTSKTPKGEQTSYYGPEEISEYGFADERVFEAKSIALGEFEKMVFMERLTNGMVTCFYFEDSDGPHFFIEQGDDILFEIHEKAAQDRPSYEVFLMNLMPDYPEISMELKKLSFTKKSITRFIERYNKQDWGPFRPTLQFGIGGGIVLDKLLVPGDIMNNKVYLIDYQFESSFSGGIYLVLNIPDKRYSFRTGLSCSEKDFDYTSSFEDDRVLTLSSSQTSISVPVLFEYNYSYKGIKPYLNAGIVYTENLKNTTSFILTSNIGNEDSDMPLVVSNHYLGLSFGMGAKLELSDFHYCFIEFQGRAQSKILSSDAFNFLQFGLSIAYIF